RRGDVRSRARLAVGVGGPDLQAADAPACAAQAVAVRDAVAAVDRVVALEVEPRLAGLQAGAVQREVGRADARAPGGRQQTAAREHDVLAATTRRARVPAGAGRAATVTEAERARPAGWSTGDVEERVRHENVPVGRQVPEAPRAGVRR